MGALFSSEPPRNPTPTRQYTTASIYTERVPPRPTPIVTNHSFRELPASRPIYSGGYNYESDFARTVRNPSTDRLNELTNRFYTLTMNQCIQECRWSSFSGTVDFIRLQEGSMEYNAIQSRFARSLRQEQPVIQKIEKVMNYILMGQYMLKREEYRRRNVRFEEKLYYHGTKQNNYMSICNENFNWRITNRNKFGKGVSFAPSSSYAIHYCDKKANRTKVMFVAKVLIGRSCLGYEDMPLPNPGFDTSQKNDGKVIVKFYDDEFYPEYLIHFTANIIHHNNNKRN